MAEAMLTHKLGQAQSACEVRSAGLGAVVGAPADPAAVRLMAGHGLDITGHRGRQLDAALLDWAELVLTMDSPQSALLLRQYPTARGKVFRLGHWEGFDVADPYGGPEESFRLALNLISLGVEHWTEKLLQ